MATAKKTPAEGKTEKPKAKTAAQPKAEPVAAGASSPEPGVQATPTGPVPEADKPFVAPDAAAPTAPADTPTAIHRLERAQALPELPKDSDATQVSDGIQAFKNSETDRRTMKVVLAGGALYKQEV